MVNVFTETNKQLYYNSFSEQCLCACSYLSCWFTWVIFFSLSICEQLYNSERSADKGGKVSLFLITINIIPYIFWNTIGHLAKQQKKIVRFLPVPYASLEDVFEEVYFTDLQ